jgi:hypothetical protein
LKHFIDPEKNGAVVRASSARKTRDILDAGGTNRSPLYRSIEIIL